MLFSWKVDQIIRNQSAGNKGGEIFQVLSYFPQCHKIQEIKQNPAILVWMKKNKLH